MEFNSILASFLFLFLLLVSVLEKSRRTLIKSGSSYSHIPGPRPLPLIGNLHQMFRGDPHRTLRDLASRHGPLMHLRLGEIHTVVVSSAAAAEEVMRTHDLNFSNRHTGLLQETLTYNYADIVFAPYGASWRRLRKICTLELLSARRVLSFRPVRAEENASLCRWIASSEGSTVDLSERLFLSTHDVVARAVVGAKTEEGGEVTAVLDQIAKLASGLLLADLYPSVKSLPFITRARSRIRGMRRKIDELFDGIIAARRRRSAAQTGDVKDLLDVLLEIRQEGSELPLTNDSIKAVLLVS